MDAGTLFLTVRCNRLLGVIPRTGLNNLNDELGYAVSVNSVKPLTGPADARVTRAEFAKKRLLDHD